jgi:hypothetical protein
MVKRYLEALATLLIASLVVVIFGCGKASSEKKSDEKGTSAVQNDQSAPAKQASTDIGSDSGAAKIFFPEVDHDFGNVSRRSTLTHTFKVLNKGDAPLKLIKAKGS